MRKLKKTAIFTLILTVSLCLSTCCSPMRGAKEDYLTVIKEAALSGDRQKGQRAAELRNRKILEEKSSEPLLDFDELMLLSKFICAQSQSFRKTGDFLICVGEVALNRVASPEFPDSLSEVIFEPGQFKCAETGEFEKLLPDRESLEAAMRLLSGERLMEGSVVYMSGEKMGPVYAASCDRVRGFTYFCRSNAQELYSCAEAGSGSVSAPGQNISASLSGEALSLLKDSCLIVYNDREK